MRTYMALLSQSGTSAPTAEVLTSQLCDAPTYHRDNEGQYHIAIAGDFDPAKTHVVFGQQFAQAQDFTLLMFSIGGGCIYFKTVANDLSSHDDELDRTPITITVFD
jgi:hypothetical protein